MIKLRALPNLDNTIAGKHGPPLTLRKVLTDCATQPSNISLIQNRKLAQTHASRGAILGHQQQTPDVEMGDKCQTY